MSIETQAGGIDWAAIGGWLIAAAGLVVGGLKWLWAKGTNREAAITAREKRYIEKVELRLREMDLRVSQVERANRLMVGLTHVMVDDLILVKPASPALQLVAVKIREAYPLVEDIPDEMLPLLHRLDHHSKGTEQ